MAINASYLEFRLSGGAGNVNPDLSLGGVKSTEVIASQSATGITMTGITARFAGGNPEGIGTLTFVSATKMASWTVAGGTPGPAVNIGADGSYALFGNSDVGLLVIDVVNASLPVADDTDPVTIANVFNELIDNVAQLDSFNGDTEYRCFYIHNRHPTDPFLAVVLFIGSQPNPGAVSIGKDAAGVGNGTTTGVATTIANENTAPAGVVFTAPITEGTGISVGGLLAGQSHAIWFKRVVPPLNTIPNPETVSLINASVFF